jgi:hypothetical protein
MRNERQMVFHTVKLGPVMVLFINVICNFDTSESYLAYLYKTKIKW